MLYPSMNDLLSKVPNRYLLVNLAAKRARDIALDAEENGMRLDEKPVKAALSDIISGRIVQSEWHEDQTEGEEISI